MKTNNVRLFTCASLLLLGFSVKAQWTTPGTRVSGNSPYTSTIFGVGIDPLTSVTPIGADLYVAGTIRTTGNNFGLAFQSNEAGVQMRHVLKYGNPGLLGNSNNLSLTSVAPNGHLFINTSPTGGVVNEVNRMMITTDGMVGVGEFSTTNLPSNPLHVVGNHVSGSGVVNIDVPSNNAAFVHINSPDKDAGIRFSRADNTQGWTVRNWSGQNDDFMIQGNGGVSSRYFLIQQSTGNTGIGTTSPAYRLDVSGQARFTNEVGVGGVPSTTQTIGGGGTLATMLSVYGNVWSSTGNYLSGSDKRFKKDISELEDVLDKLENIKGYSYAYRTDEFPAYKFNEGRSLGLLAQELKEEFPEMVRQNEEGYYSVNYDAMIPVLLQAIKEQQKEINALKATNAGSFTAGIENAVASGSVLYQNAPNPFNDQTVIKYELADPNAQAQIMILNMNGKMLKSIDLNNEGRITIDGRTLEAGMYLYTLVIDGREIDTKRMILTK